MGRLNHRSLFRESSVLPPPYDFSNVAFRVATLKAGTFELQRICNDFLNEVTDPCENRRFSPLRAGGGVSPLLLRFTHAPEDDERPGFKEASLTIPVIESVNGKPRDLVFFTPWSLATDLQWTATGNEVHGQLRAMGNVHMADETRGACFVSLRADSPRLIELIPSVDEPPPLGPVPYQNLLRAIDDLDEGAKRLLEDNIKGDRDPQVGMKQMRDIDGPDKASYRELTRFLVKAHYDRTGHYTGLVVNVPDERLRTTFGLKLVEGSADQIDLFSAGFYFARVQIIEPCVLTSVAPYVPSPPLADNKPVKCAPEPKYPSPCQPSVGDWVEAISDLHRAHVRAWMTLAFPWCFWWTTPPRPPTSGSDCAPGRA